MEKKSSKHRMATVINYCSNDEKFLPSCIEQARKFSSQICIPVADHFFDGKKEDMTSLRACYAEFSDCDFIQFPFLPDLLPLQLMQEVGHPRIWHNIARSIGFSMLQPGIEYVLFLDADEVVDGDRFLSWLDSGQYRKFSAMKLCNYWYFRDTCYRANEWEDSLLFVKAHALRAKLLLHKDERDGIFHGVKGEKARKVLGLDSLPLAHHYSWVRSEKEMQKKVKSWGHRDDRDWDKDIAEEFSRDFQGKDFVHGYEYTTVKSFIHPRKIDRNTEKDPKILVSKEQFSNILGLSKSFLSHLLQKIGIYT